ncbi:MAG: nuclear transport factor 2 family protein [Actinobacteria bacterium]|nr:MAG: nuclear transport factor 2 family protein [Actinomycetota bacterium]
MSREAVELLRGLYERWSEGDFSTVDVFDPQVEFARIGPEVVPGQGGPGRWRGREEMWRAIVEWLRLWDEFHVEAEDFIDLGERVLVLSRQTARGKLSSTPVEKELGEVFTLRERRIVCWEAYWDRDDARRAVGLETPDHRSA